MLSKNIIERNRIYTVCEKSGDILPGAAFCGVVIGAHGSYTIYPNAKIVCCGKVSDNELLFCTVDGRHYFSVCDGWGEENGTLYGLRFGFHYDFKHPTTADTILAECEADIGTYGTWAGALVYQSKKHALDVIRSVMKRGAI